MIRLALLVIMAISFLMPGFLRAGPDSVIKYLMNEPVSMLDWGIYKLEKNLDTVFVDREVITNIEYSYKQNKLIVNSWLFPVSTTKPRDKNETKNKCKETIEIARQILTMGEINLFFKHNGFKNRDSVNVTDEHIRGIIELSCSGDYNSGIIHSKSALYDKEIYFTDGK